MDELESLLHRSIPDRLLPGEHLKLLARQLRGRQVPHEQIAIWPMRRYAFLLGLGALLLFGGILSPMHNPQPLRFPEEEWIMAGLSLEVNEKPVQTRSSLHFSLMRYAANPRPSMQAISGALEERRKVLAEVGLQPGS